MYDAIAAFLAHHYARAALFGSVLLVPWLIWAVPTFIEEFELKKKFRNKRERSSSTDVAWGC